MGIPCWVCSQNKKHTRALTEGEEDLFPGPMSPINCRLMMELMWDLVEQLRLPSVRQMAKRLGVREEQLRPYYRRVLHYLFLRQEEANEGLELGGAGDSKPQWETPRHAEGGMEGTQRQAGLAGPPRPL